MVDINCKYCGFPIDVNADQDYRKQFPQGIHTRMSHGAAQDEDGNWYHIFVWQCIRAHGAQE